MLIPLQTLLSQQSEGLLERRPVVALAHSKSNCVALKTNGARAYDPRVRRTALIQFREQAEAGSY